MKTFNFLYLGCFIPMQSWTMFWTMPFGIPIIQKKIFQFFSNLGEPVCFEDGYNQK